MEKNEKNPLTKISFLDRIDYEFIYIPIRCEKQVQDANTVFSMVFGQNVQRTPTQLTDFFLVTSVESHNFFLY